MKKIINVIGLMALLSTGCTNSTTSDKKRYELVTCPFTVNNTTYIGMRILDTYTGDVWSYAGMRKDQDSNWIYSGNPTKANVKQ